MQISRRTAMGALALLPLAAAGQTRTRVVTMTRQVKVFMTLELELFDAQAAGDAERVDRLIAADFEQRSAEQPGNPMPRAEWRAALRSHWPGENFIEQMAVHDRGDTAIVSFLVRPTQGPARFVVDAWVKAGAGWQLGVRYLSAGG
jgi:hypothetical protein